MRIIICGSMTFTDGVLLRKTMDNLTSKLKRVTVMSNHNKGASRFGEEWANERGHLYQIWREGDEQMVDHADCCAVFGQDKETKNLMKLAKKKGLKIRIIKVKT